MLKIGQNWSKIANYPPQCSTKIGTPGCSAQLLYSVAEKKRPHAVAYAGFERRGARKFENNEDQKKKFLHLESVRFFAQN